MQRLRSVLRTRLEFTEIVCMFVLIKTIEKNNEMKQDMPRIIIISAFCLLLLIIGPGFKGIMQEQSPVVQGQIPKAPPEDIGKSSLNDLCSRYGIDQDLVIKTLSFKGIALEPGILLKKAAENNGLTPAALYGMIREAAFGQKL
ncbi:MAG: hypothetical protein MI863_13380 [Desulfobacterales bacterium]|nr:hypothetical protein [Desulfobacterales bacterium]